MRSATMEHTEQLERCIEDCQGCHSICLQTINHCLDKGGRHTEAQHIRLLQDCVQICQTGADFMIRGSDRHGLTCFVCSEVCDACAGDCEQFQGDQQMQACAEMCRTCSTSCREMAETMGVTGEDSFEGGGGVDYGEAFEEVAEGIMKESRSG